MGEPPDMLASERVLDPRGTVTSTPAALAPRVGPPVGRRLLLFDNGKMAPGIGAFEAVLPTLTRAFQQRRLPVFEERRYDLMRLDRPGTATLAGRLAAEGYAGAVVGLCDSGVTPATILFAAELERAGVPTVTLCRDATLGLAAASAAYLVPGLPLVSIATSRLDDWEQVVSETERVIDAVVRGLTVTPSRGAVDVDVTGRRWDVPRDGSQGRDALWRGDPVYEGFADADLTDGLPIVPPTAERVDRMLAWTDRPCDRVVVDALPPSGAAVSIQNLAVAAVMAGCRPEYFPFVVAAMEAMAAEPYRLFQALITSHPSGNAIVFSGPLTREVGLASDGGCLGPGFRANATIGRAIGLCLLNTSRAVPGRSDLAVFGSPAEYSYCFAEAVDQTPWSPMHQELYDTETTSVTIQRCEAPHNVVDYLSTTPEGVLGSVAAVAATIGGNNAYVPSELLVMLSPEHARIVARAGWSKRDVQQFLFEHARLPAAMLAGRGVPPIPPRSPAPNDLVPVVDTPAQVLVFVAGGEGPHSMVGIPWGFARAVSRPLALLDGRPIRHLLQARATHD